MTCRTPARHCLASLPGYRVSQESVHLEHLDFLNCKFGKLAVAIPVTVMRNRGLYFHKYKSADWVPCNPWPPPTPTLKEVCTRAVI